MSSKNNKNIYNQMDQQKIIKLDKLDKIIEFQEINEQKEKQELEELTKLLQDLHTIKEINQELALIIGEQTENIQTISEEITKANTVIETSNLELQEANEYNVVYTGTKLTVTTIGTTIVSAIAVSVAGVKIGLILGIVALTSGTVWSIWPEKINK